MKVMLCTDGSECANKAVVFAAGFAEHYKVDLTILHVIEDIVQQKKLPNYPEFKEKKDKAEEILSQTKQLAKDCCNVVNYKEKLACGPVSSEIVRIAEEERFDVIVIGTRGLRGLKRMLMGSVAAEVLQHAHCPVTVVR